MTVEGAAYEPWNCLGGYDEEGYVLYVDIGPGPRKLEALLPMSDSEIVTVSREGERIRYAGRGSNIYTESRSRLTLWRVHGTSKGLRCWNGGKGSGRY